MRVLAVALLYCVYNTAAFTIHTPSHDHRRVKLSFSRQNYGDYTTAEVEEMDALIVSLSLEPTDKSRRQRLSAVFATELQEDDSKRFTNLFDQVLAIVGDRIQQKAKQKAMELQQQQMSSEEEEELSVDEDNASVENDEGEFLSMGKSAEEKQLWAMIDIMVQSKTLAKRASGELGSKGTLQ